MHKVEIRNDLGNEIGNQTIEASSLKLKNDCRMEQTKQSKFQILDMPYEQIPTAENEKDIIET